MAATGPTFSLFFSYSHKDEALRDALEEHLSLLKREGRIDAWHDRRIGAGREWEGQIDARLEAADLVLLLISPSFIASDYCFDREMGRALERHDAGEARVIPVILRPCDWKTARFAKLQALPKDVQPVTRWPDQDEAFLDVVAGIRRALEDLPRRRVPESAYSDDTTRDLSLELEAAYEERAEVLASNGDPTEVNETIVGLKRRLRAGPQLEPGDFLFEGRFKLLETLGRGGFATVWKAYDRDQKALVAVKVLHSQYSKDRSRLDRFFRGARQMAALKHPGVVSVIEPKCEDDGYHFFVMEYLPGGDFREAVRADRLDLEERLQVVRAIGEALSHAHQQGTIHRDVKPANILLDLDGGAKLTDFDLVRAADTTGGTRTGALGTFLYAAPESLLDGKQASERADVYGLGMTAVFALHGADLPMEVLFEPAQFLGQLDCGDLLRHALSRAIHRKQNKRWLSIAEFCAALGREDSPSPKQQTTSEGTTIQVSRPSPQDASQIRKRLAQATDLEERVEVILQIPEQSPDAPSALELINELRLHTRSGNDLCLLDVAAEQVALKPGWEDHARATHLLRLQLYNHLPAPPADLFETANVQGDNLPLWCRIPAGRFTMGSPGDEEGRWDDEGPQHEVLIESDFRLAAVPVTQAQYAAFEPEHSCRFQGDQRPVDSVTWYQAAAFCGWLERRGGLKGARLPTEEEWEYACRAGTTTRYWSGDSEDDLKRVGWYGENSGGENHTVGEKPPNEWGLYDMHGNVYEWTVTPWTDDFSERRAPHPVDPAALPADPAGPSPRAPRVVRGGSFGDSARGARSAYRGVRDPGAEFRYLGFRVLLSFAPSES